LRAHLLEFSVEDAANETLKCSFVISCWC
jgi:hypothetical protein